MREEYPRPELVRKQWMNLNGEWDFAFDFGVSGVEMYFFDNRNKGYRFAELGAQQFDKKINVPFCPESKLSGIGYTNFIGACCYLKTKRKDDHRGYDTAVAGSENKSKRRQRRDRGDRYGNGCAVQTKQHIQRPVFERGN